jgi:predicted lipoprotein with Yx(FWY)xxD motif
MKTKKLRYSLLTTVAALVLLSTSCSKNSNNPAKPTPTPVVVTGLKLTTNVTLGNIITDNNGMAVYFFSKDVAGTPSCVDACAVKWPPFYKENPSLGTGLSATDFGVVTRADGSKQTTYKGWPLHYFSGDINAGDANGDAFANLWAVAKADYSVMFGNAQLIGLDAALYTDQGVAGTGASTFITDPLGRTLYMFSKDTHATNIFTNRFRQNTVYHYYRICTYPISI